MRRLTVKIRQMSITVSIKYIGVQPGVRPSVRLSVPGRAPRTRSPAHARSLGPAARRVPLPGPGPGDAAIAFPSPRAVRRTTSAAAPCRQHGAATPPRRCAVSDCRRRGAAPPGSGCAPAGVEPRRRGPLVPAPFLGPRLRAGAPRGRQRCCGSSAGLSLPAPGRASSALLASQGCVWVCVCHQPPAGQLGLGRTGSAALQRRAPIAFRYA